jgi:hypothetical protein
MVTETDTDIDMVTDLDQVTVADEVMHMDMDTDLDWIQTQTCTQKWTWTWKWTKTLSMVMEIGLKITNRCGACAGAIIVKKPGGRKYHATDRSHATDPCCAKKLENPRISDITDEKKKKRLRQSR